MKVGNQFLANIRECDAIAHVLRCFENSNISHVEGRVDPVQDLEVIETELMLADLQTIENVVGLARKLKSSDPEAKEKAELLELARSD